MNNDSAKTSAAIAEELAEADPQDQAALLLHLLETNPAAMTELLHTRARAGENNRPSAHGSSWPTHPGDHRNESTPQGRGRT